ncbi:hypothetical protein AAC387_Pa01g3040 [Persea americana]
MWKLKLQQSTYSGKSLDYYFFSLLETVAACSYAYAVALFRDIGLGNTRLLQCRGDYDHILVPETGSTPFCRLTRDAFELCISSSILSP